MSDSSPPPPTRFRAMIRAYDLERSLEFYKDMLGLEVITSWEHDGGGVLLDAAGGVVELLGKPPAMKMRGGWDFIPPTAKIDLILEVPDVDAWYSTLVARGVEPQSEPQDAPWGGRSFVVLDPDETPVHFLTIKREHP
jgi:catechol 2,3-dioxygenase-like lactoylglutathione lyase family enzyme